jgi:glutamate racemase
VIEPGGSGHWQRLRPIAVIATEGTVRGGAYVRAIQARSPQMPVVQQACPLFVALAEEGLRDGPITELAAHRYLDPLLATMPRPRGLVLGCTHFPVLKQTIAKVAGPDVALIDSAETSAIAVEKYSKRNHCRQRQRLRFSWPPTRQTALPIWARFSWANRSIRET